MGVRVGIIVYHGNTNSYNVEFCNELKQMMWARRFAPFFQGKVIAMDGSYTEQLIEITCPVCISDAYRTHIRCISDAYQMHIRCISDA
jgi:hypothetical protein